MILDIRIKNLLEQLSLNEKVALCSGKDFWHLHGVERLNLPSIMVTDGPHGLRKQPDGADHLGLNNSVPATCFPTASGLAATWNVELLGLVGEALGRESRCEGVSVLLGPGVNIKRNPLGGRNFEYFSEDPYLSGQLSIAWVDGVQSQQVGASLKHYAVNNHENGRMVVDVVVDERTLREMYLPAFEFCIKQSQPWTIMCSYNKVGGMYVSEHRELLTTILQEEWRYEGLVVTDWGACNDRVMGIKNGQHLDMPSSEGLNTKTILTAINDGSLTEKELDNSVARVLELIEKSREPLSSRPKFSEDEHHALARRVAEEACVLLKNDDDILPLKPQRSVAIVGALANNTRYQGSGSSQINPTTLEQPLSQIRDLVSSLVEGGGDNVCYAQGYHLSDDDSPTASVLIEEALSIVQQSDYVVVVIGLQEEHESEGFDRPHMQLPSAQLALLNALEFVYHKLVVVLQNGAPVELPFANEVPAILEAYLGGQAGASAIANILFGHANPSGKLAETFPLTINDVPSQSWFPGELRQSQYREGLWVGYRYFDTTDTAVAFPFGHGLSYTTFDYSGLKIVGMKEVVSNGTDLNTFPMREEDSVKVSFTLKNSGDRAGAEVVQVYVGQKSSSVYRPKKELKGFEKIFLRAGEQQEISIILDQRAFAFWCVQQKKWLAETGQFYISVGASVVDIRLKKIIQLETDTHISEPNPALASYAKPKKNDFDDQAFAALLGHPIPKALPAMPFQLNTSLGEIKHTWLGRQLIKVMLNAMQKMLGEEMSAKDRSLAEGMVEGMTLRQLLLMGGGKIGPKSIKVLIHALNKDWLKLITGAEIFSH